jgi:hypothetical protein
MAVPQTIYLGSLSSFAGKSLVGLGLVNFFKEKGLTLSCLKPLATFGVESEEGILDEDVALLTERGKLRKEDVVCAVEFNELEVLKVLKSKSKNLIDKIKEIYQRIGKDKDIVLIIGANSLNQGLLLGISPYQLLEIIDFSLLLIVSYKNAFIVEEIMGVNMTFQKRLLGVIFNNVTKNKMDEVEKSISPYLIKEGIRVLGIIPEDSVLKSISVAGLQEYLGAELICGKEYQAELISHFSVGAMQVESALRYFRRLTNKAVITGGDRADIQLAALATSTKCLILTGGLYPNSLILAKAEEVKVPILVVKEDTLTTVEKIENRLGRVPLKEPARLERALTLVKEYVDLDEIYKLTCH